MGVTGGTAHTHTIFINPLLDLMQAASAYLFAFDPHDLQLADIIADDR